jgi:hypothetical protein
VIASTSGGDVLLHLLRPRRAGDHAGYVRLAHQPADREVDHRVPAHLREAAQLLEHVEVGVSKNALRSIAPERQARALRQRLATLVLPGEKAARQREVRQHAKPELLARRHELALDPPVEQVVLVLSRRVRRQAPVPRDPGGVGDLPAAEVGAADVPHLARAHDVVERAQRLLLRRARVREVELVEVDVVGAETAQARVDGIEDVSPRRARHQRSVAHRPAELGADDGALPLALQRLSEELLRPAASAVDVRGVEQRDAEVERLAHDLLRLRGIDAHAEVVAAEPDRRDL